MLLCLQCGSKTMQVLGHAPYSESCHLPTRELGELIMRQMHCPPDVDEATYFRHLAIFVSNYSLHTFYIKPLHPIEKVC